MGKALAHQYHFCLAAASHVDPDRDKQPLYGGYYYMEITTQFKRTSLANAVLILPD
jgi:hypothetical protein